MLYLLTIGLFILFRILQRLYYIWRVPQQRHYSPSFSPKAALEQWLSINAISNKTYSIKSTLDQTDIVFRTIGTGPRKVLLANGVGTGFFMWLPTLTAMLQQDPNLFTKCTLIVSTYRGLFVENDNQFHQSKVDITVHKCIGDILDILDHLKMGSLDGLIGWSTGAQIGYNLSLLHPHRIKSLFLLNPTAGSTLHYALQPFTPLPGVFRESIAGIIKATAGLVNVILPTSLFDILKKVNDSFGFHMFLVSLAFFGGFPPIQPVYFHEYMRDTFHTRSQIRALFDLILCLDTPEITMQDTDNEKIKENKLPTAKSSNASDLRRKIYEHSVIVSSLPDFMTGCYLSNHVEQNMLQMIEKESETTCGSGRKVRHVSFTMGSHFVLIEWPDLLAQELLMYVNQELHK